MGTGGLYTILPQEFFMGDSRVKTDDLLRRVSTKRERRFIEQFFFGKGLNFRTFSIMLFPSGQEGVTVGPHKSKKPFWKLLDHPPS